VSTDKADYAPGAKATITASGFAEGSTIQFAIADDPNHPGTDGVANVYKPFSITDGGAGDPDGAANGQVVTTWVVPPDPDGFGPAIASALGATLNLTATGSDGQVATTTFTDALLGGFNIDGNVLGTGGAEVDAVFFFDPSGSVAELGAINSNTTKVGVIDTDIPPTLEYTNVNPGQDLSGV